MSRDGDQSLPILSDRSISSFLGLEWKANEDNHVGQSKNVQMNARNSVLPGSLRQAGSAGLLTEQYVKDPFKRIGMRR